MYTPTGPPSFIVSKNKGMLQMSIYFRILNKQTKNYTYPIPKIDNILDYLCKTQVLSKIDLSKAYHQVAVELSHTRTKPFFLPNMNLSSFWSYHLDCQRHQTKFMAA